LKKGGDVGAKRSGRAGEGGRGDTKDWLIPFQFDKPIWGNSLEWVNLLQTGRGGKRIGGAGRGEGGSGSGNHV